MVVVLLLIAFAATGVPLETKALPVKNVCSSETVDSSKKKSVSQLSLLISIYAHELLHIFSAIYFSVCVCFLWLINSAIYFVQLIKNVLDCSTDITYLTHN